MKNLIKTAAAMILLAVTVHAQHADHQMKNEEKSKGPDMIKMMGIPTFEQSVEGVKVQVWLMTQKEHKKKMSEHQKEMKHDMKGMDHGDMKMDHDMKEMDHDKKHGSHDHSKMMEGTHHIMAALTDERSENVIDDAKIFLEVTSPSQKSTSFELTGMMSHFGGGVTLDEKGKYTLTVGFRAGKEIKRTQFIYENK